MIGRGAVQPCRGSKEWRYFAFPAVRLHSVSTQCAIATVGAIRSIGRGTARQAVDPTRKDGCRPAQRDQPAKAGPGEAAAVSA